MFENTLSSYKRWRRYRSTLNELKTLTRRELDDIGISPADISRIAKNSAYSK